MPKVAATSSILDLNAGGGSVLPAESLQVRWYAAYTVANHEKRVAEQLIQRPVEFFLPLYASMRKWKDRRVTLDLPLFPGYVFVQIALRDRLKVLQIPGVANLVSFGGTPVALPEGEIEALRTSLGSGLPVEPHPFLTAGRRVRIKSGPLAGLEGIVIRRRNRLRLIISLALIHCAASVEVEAADLEGVR